MKHNGPSGGPHMKKHPSASQILDDIETLYTLALEKGNFSAALKAKELIGREYGLFLPHSYRKNLALKDFSDEELDFLIRKIEAQLTEGIDRRTQDR